jgi:hypothetical protein
MKKEASFGLLQSTLQQVREELRWLTRLNEALRALPERSPTGSHHCAQEIGLQVVSASVSAWSARLRKHAATGQAAKPDEPSMAGWRRCGVCKTRGWSRR